MFITPAMAQSLDPGAGVLFGFGALGIVLVLVGLVLYFVPTIIAFRRGHPNRWIIFLVNFLLGATLIGWIAALVWSLLAVHITGDGQIVNRTSSSSTSG